MSIQTLRTAYKLLPILDEAIRGYGAEGRHAKAVALRSERTKLYRLINQSEQDVFRKPSIC